MEAKQKMVQTIQRGAIEAAKAAIMAVKEAENPVNTARSIEGMPRTGGPALKESIFD